jgi:hypothetical protein
MAIYNVGVLDDFGEDEAFLLPCAHYYITSLELELLQTQMTQKHCFG